ncbi:hypothetical protein MiSe_85940 [Microseira wollei NIES-4236]|uniref:Uncharacterized protein n=1 Tax=Microseira wollei NIES-4236 TaxID=2530354 RepID=A0AAV3XS37_9CYAN|nr:hypothetical protein MiSe_85940 [Microseira wollei NIES-4236]
MLLVNSARGLTLLKRRFCLSATPFPAGEALLEVRFCEFTDGKFLAGQPGKLQILAARAF